MSRLNSILERGLIGHWTMSDVDTSGSTLYDSTAYNNHGELNGPSQTAGLFNGAYDFEDDNNDYVDLGVVGDEFAIGRGDYTFCFWAKFESITSNSTVFELSRYTDALLVRPDNRGPQLQIYMRNQETNDTFFPDIEGNTDKWYHFVIRRTGSDLEVFENNTSLGVKPDMDGVFEINQESYIGRSVHTGGQNHDGLLQDIRFYNRALSNSEVSALYNMRSQRQQNIVANVTYNNIQSYYDANNHPNSKSGLDAFFDKSNSGVSNIFTTNHDRSSINHGAEGQSTSEFGTVNSTPYYFSNFDGYSWKLEGQWTAPETGTYTFGIDSDDASDVLIDGSAVATFYGGHGFDGSVSNHSGTIDLSAGQRYRVAFRYEEGGGGSGITVGYQKPSDSSYVLFPADKVF